MKDGSLPGGLLFCSVIVKWCKHDEIDTTLNLLVCYPGGEVREVFYENVFYTQLDESVRGMTILSAEKITLSEFLSEKHQKSAARYAGAYHDPHFTKLKDMMGRGFKLFMHYMEYDAEYVVLADRMAVSD